MYATLYNFRRSASSSDSTNKIRLKPEKRQASSPSLNSQQANPRFLWIRLALFEKKLAKIVDHLVQNSK